MAYREMTSEVTITGEQFFLQNEAIFMEALKKIDPELMLVKTYLLHTRLPASALPPIIDELSALVSGKGNGELIVEVRDGHIIGCKRIVEYRRGIDTTAIL